MRREVAAKFSGTTGGADNFVHLLIESVAGRLIYGGIGPVEEGVKTRVGPSGVVESGIGRDDAKQSDWFDR